MSGELPPQTLELIDVRGNRIAATVRLSDRRWNEGQYEKTECRIILGYGEVGLTAVARDYFEALCRLREKLAQLQLIPYCYGASRNVFPSGMARDMGLGLKAYKMQPGKNCRSTDLVGIFDSGPDIDLASVNDQQSFVEEWRRMPKS